MPTTPTNSDSSGAQVTNQINSVARDVQALQTTQIFKDDSGTRRVLLGKGADGFYGLKVSQAGTDVYDATDEQLVFNSGQNVFKIVQKGETTVSADNSGGTGVVGTVTVTHNLGYIPVVLGFFGDGSLHSPLPKILSSSVSTSVDIKEYVSIEAITSTTFQVWYYKANAGSASYPIVYYVLQETAT